MHVVIVGAGLIGTCTAWYLRQHGVDVTVIERADAPGMETSFANAGMLTPSMADPWNSPGTLRKLIKWLGREDAPMLLRLHAVPSLSRWGMAFLLNSSEERFRTNTLKNVALANYSLDLLRSLRADLSLNYDQMSAGTLRACRDQVSLDHAAGLAEFLKPHGVEYKVLDRDGVTRAEPALAPVAQRLVGGIHYSGDESGDAHLFCQALGKACAAAGVQFLFGQEVTDASRSGDQFILGTPGAKDIHADAVVLATGSYTPSLASKVGLRVPVRPVKGYSITVPRGDWRDGPRIPVADDHLHTAVTPLGDRIRVAGTAEFTGHDAALTPARIDNLFSLLEAIYPEFARRLDRPSAKPWCGFRPMSADGVPILGATRIPGLFVNTGQGHLGWTMAAGSGKAVADSIVGAPPELKIDDYSLARF
jgi:D-amino-acid dehydrogenase